MQAFVNRRAGIRNNIRIKIEKEIGISKLYSTYFPVEFKKRTSGPKPLKKLMKKIIRKLLSPWEMLFHGLHWVYGIFTILIFTPNIKSPYPYIIICLSLAFLHFHLKQARQSGVDELLRRFLSKEDQEKYHLK